MSWRDNKRDKFYLQSASHLTYHPVCPDGAAFCRIQQKFEWMTHLNKIIQTSGEDVRAVYAQVLRIAVHEQVNALKVECGGQLTLSLLVSEHCPRALHVCLEELRGCDQTGLLCWRETTRLGFGTWSGAAADTGQILRTHNASVSVTEYEDSANVNMAAGSPTKVCM